MAVSLHVRDYRGIKSADISCSPIALLAAANAAGKSSVGMAVAAALTGTALPKVFELTKGEAGQIVRSGAQSASVRLICESGEATIRWPDCTYGTTGANPPHASEFAAGLASIATMPVKERPAALRPYLKADPTRDDLAHALEENFKTESIEALWQEIERKGWDDTHTNYDNRRRDARRDWEKITGGSFGSDKARTWRPDDWLADLEEVEDAELERLTKAAAEAYDKAIRQQATSAADIDRLRAELRALPERRSVATAKSEIAQKVSADLTAALAQRRDLPDDPATAKTLHCPCCNEAVMMVGGALVKYAPPDPREIKALRHKRAELDGTVEQLQAAKRTADQDLTAAQFALREALRAEEVLKTATESSGAGSADAVEQSRIAIDVARRNTVMVKQVEEATRLYREWIRSDLIIKAVAPTGLRARKMAEGLGGFNAQLSSLSSTAGWSAPVNLTDDLRVRLGERPYSLLSDSEKFRIRTTLQIAQAQLDGSSMVVIDGFDILDREGRNGAFAMLSDAGIEALICMTALEGAPMPDLAEAGLGGSWVITDGIACPMGGEEQEEEAA